jgi:hypothetical protein
MNNGPPAASPRVLDVQPMGTFASVRLLLVTPGVVGVVVGWMTLRESSPLNPLWFLFFLTTVMMLWLSTLPSALSIVRFTRKEGAIRIEWRRFGRMLRTTEYPLQELKDVALEADPAAKRVATYRVVLGTRGWDLPLMMTYSGNVEDQERVCAEVATFLDLPRRTRGEVPAGGVNVDVRTE